MTKKSGETGQKISPNPRKSATCPNYRSEWNFNSSDGNTVEYKFKNQNQQSS